ncbi:MAG: hypothetical protein PUF41_04775 [Prevotella copri]|nr:hypothetical protein [Segatella copri]
MAENTTNTTTTRRYEGVVYMRTLIAEEAKNTEDYLKSYIGETTDWNTRQQKWYQANNKNYGGKKIQVARDKYGVSDDAWATVILERNYSEVSIDDLEKKLKARETEKIYEYDTVNNGFNGSYGDGMKGRNHTDKSRKLISKNHRNYQSDDAKVKIKAYQQEHGTKLIAIAPDGTETEFNTITDAANKTGVPYSTIYNILNRGHKGEKWGYKFKKV